MQMSTRHALSALFRGQNVPFAWSGDVCTLNPGRYPIRVPTLEFQGLQDVTVEAAGVTLVATCPTAPVLRFLDCQGVGVRGLTLDYDPLPFTQGRIVALDPSRRTVDLELDTGYPDLTEAYQVRHAHLFTEDGMRWEANAPDYYLLRVEPLSPRKVRLYFNPDTCGWEYLSMGGRMVLNMRKSAGVEVRYHCRDLSFEDVTVHAAPGVAFLVRFAETGCVFRRVRVVPGPPPSGSNEPRLMSSNADAINIAYTRRGPLIEECEFAWMGDDAINLHGFTLPVLERQGPGTMLTARPRIAREDLRELFRTGDVFRFLAEPDFRCLGEVRLKEILEVEAPHLNWPQIRDRVWPSFAAIAEGRYFSLVFAGEIPACQDPMHLEAFVSSAPGYSIRNNYLHDHRGRGMRLMSGNGLVEGNRFERIKASAISIGPEFRHWMEGGWVENVLVKDNSIVDVATGEHQLSPDNYTPGAIAVFARVHPAGDDTCFYSGNTGLKFVANRISGSRLPAFHICAARDVQLCGNTIQNVNTHTTAGRAYGLRPDAPVSVHASVEQCTVDIRPQEATAKPFALL